MYKIIQFTLYELYQSIYALKLRLIRIYFKTKFLIPLLILNITHFVIVVLCDLLLKTVEA